jgi:ABC-type dipeptide/oligopeptide/nickel transport system permease subunit
METENHNEIAEQEKLFKGTLWLNAKAFGLVLGLLCGMIIFIATNWLVIKGGDQIGPHLQLLSQYFIGYRVTFLGSLIGFAYGFALGTLSGAFIGWIYNKIATFRV